MTWAEEPDVATHSDMLAAIFFIAGLCMAVQEALESTVTAGIVSADRLATSYGVLGAVNGKFLSIAAVGVSWTIVSPVLSFGLAALMMGAGTIALARML